MGILKRKVIDQARAQAKQPAALENDPVVSALFDKRGNWSKSAKANSAMRLDSIEREEFKVVLQDCLEKLPPLKRLLSGFVKSSKKVLRKFVRRLTFRRQTFGF